MFDQNQSLAVLALTNHVATQVTSRRKKGRKENFERGNENLR